MKKLFTITGTAAALACAGALLVPATGAAAGTTAAAKCPAPEIVTVWYGGTSDNRACDHLNGDFFDHMFFNGKMLSTKLRSGYHEEVVFVQLALRDRGFRPVAVDGSFGPQTEAAVKRYQKAYHLVVDGKVGVQTWKSIFGLGYA